MKLSTQGIYKKVISRDDQITITCKMNCLTFSPVRKLVNLFRNLNKFKHKRHIKSLMEEFAMYLTCTDFLKVLLSQSQVTVLLLHHLPKLAGLPVMSDLDINCPVSVCIVCKAMAKR